MKPKQLTIPPITEAILEFRFNPDKRVTLERVQEFSHFYKKTFPYQEKIENRNLTLALEDVGESRLTVNPVGFKLTSSNEKKAVFATLDRIAINLQAPYSSWDSFRSLGKEIYENYVSHVPQEQLTRVGLRYINRVSFAEPGQDVDDLINTFPGIPQHPEIPDVFSYFDSTVHIPFEDLGCLSRIKQKFEVDKSSPSGFAFILDTDTYRHMELAPSDPSIWDLLNKFRQKKNAIFFGTFKEGALSGYE